jgi:2-methoxy-6-polyprenyl-1,4-benzoquinol methylase
MGYSVFNAGYQQVPKNEKQSLVGQVFRSVAPSYDIMNDLMSVGMHRLWKDHLVKSLAPFPGMKHLDVAGGTGDIAFRVLEAIKVAERRITHHERWPSSTEPKEGSAQHVTDRPPAGSVVVCDINESMLKEGEKKAVHRSITPEEMQWIVGNAENLPFEDGSFDSYTIGFGIRNVTDRDAALREAKRVLRPGGRFMCLEFSKVVVPGLQQLYDVYSFNVIPEIGRLVAGDAHSYQYLVESIRMFPGQQEFARMIKDAGFTEVEWENLSTGIVAIHTGINPGTR